MISKIIYFSIRHKFLVLLLVLAIIGGGIYALRTINVDSTPDITNNQVQVITVSENLSTTDIEQYVTYPVELAMANLPGVEDIRSVSRFGLSVVTIVFKDNMGTYLPRQLVQEKLEEVREEIPEGFGSPQMGPITTGLGEIYQYTLVPDDTAAYTPQELRTLQDWIVKRQMAMIPDVVEVNSFGGSIKQYEVKLCPERLNAMGVTLSEVYEALQRNNVNTGGAYIEKNHLANFIRGEGLVTSLDDIRAIVIKVRGGAPVTVGGVAEAVGYGAQVRYGAFTQDGREAVGGMVLMLKGANSDKVVRAVKERMQAVQQSLPPGIKVKPFLDRTNLIQRTTSTIARNLTEGALIVVFVLVLLLGSVRGGIITASVIPLSLLFAFILMRIFGVWANLMSLGAIDFGIIVDGAVIIVEGIVGSVQQHLARHQRVLSPAETDEVSGQAAATMMHSAFFGQLIILIVFTPIIFLSGVSGKMFAPMVYTFSFAVLGALLLCLTYVPVVTAWLMRPRQGRLSVLIRMEQRLGRWSERLIHAIVGIYHPALKWALRHKRTVIGTAMGFFALTLVAFSRMGGEFIPELDEGDIAMQTFLRPGSSLSETIKREEEVERLLLSNFPEVKTVCARIGVADIPTDPMGFDYTDSFIILEKDKSKWTSAKTKEELIEKMKAKLMTLPGLNFSFSQPVALRFNELLTGVREDVAVKLYGDDLDELNRLGEQMVSIIQKVPGAGDVSLERTAGLPQITVRYDRRRLAQYGLRIDQLNQYISAAFAGASAGVVFEGEKRFDLVVRLSDYHRQSLNDIERLFVATPSGAQIPLSEVADISYQDGPMQISRERTSRRIYVGVNVRGRDVESVVGDIRAHLDKQLSLPAGYRLEYGGEFQNLQEAKSRLMIVLPIAMVLIFILLYFALKSVKQSLMIYIAVPLAAIGGVLALLVRGMSFSISAGVGFIVLFGVAVLNGLVLINRLNSLRDEGMANIYRRVLTATHERLRPILLTATAAMLGFLPMAVSASAGAEVQRPLATVVIGGLFSATLLTLIVVPVLYVLEQQLRRGTLPIINKHNMKPETKGLMVVALLATALTTQAQQPITLSEALRIAEGSHSSVAIAQKEVQRERILQCGVNDLGDTELSSGFEELGRGNDAVYTLLSVKQNLNLLGRGVRRRNQQQAVTAAEASATLTAARLQKEVSRAYATAFIARKRWEVSQGVDSVYQQFEQAALKRYNARETSYLEYITAHQKAQEATENTLAAKDDYDIALVTLAQWLGRNGYEPIEAPELSLKQPTDSGATSPLLKYYAEQEKLSENGIRLEQSKRLPSFFVEGGAQKIGTRYGFWSLNVGMSLPLFARSYNAREKAARVDHDIAEARLQEQQQLLTRSRQRLALQSQKLSRQLDYYRTVALPTAMELQQRAQAAYRLGSTSYTGFIQTIGDALQTQFDYWKAYEEWINTQIEINYTNI